MNSATELPGNPFVSAYSLARRLGILETSIGRRLFKSAYFFYKRYVEDDLEDLVQLFPNLVRGGNVLDIGANIGYTATVLARATDPGSKVYAFEPEPFNFGILEQTAREPEFEGKIIPLQRAVGAEDGTIALWVNDRHHGDHRIITEQFRSENPREKEIAVTQLSVDSFLRGNQESVSFVKIDVQGYELAVLQGMRETLRQNPNLTIVLEFMPPAMRDLGFEPSHLLDFFAEQEYKIFCVHPRGMLSEGVPSSLEDTSYCNLLFRRRPIEREGRAR